MSISISQINLDSEVHREIVMKLCNRNNFYKDDVYIELYRNFPPERKSKMIELLGISHFNNINNEFNKHIEEKFDGLKSIGYFITIEKDNKKKVAGFIIYNLEEIMNKSGLKSYLLFILIDKTYQKNGLGTKLIEKYIEDLTQKNILYATVKIENKILSDFYKKFGFDKHSDLIESEDDGIHELLHYISQPNILVIKKLKTLFKIVNQI